MSIFAQNNLELISVKKKIPVTVKMIDFVGLNPALERHKIHFNLNFLYCE